MYSHVRIKFGLSEEYHENVVLVNDKGNNYNLWNSLRFPPLHSTLNIESSDMLHSQFAIFPEKVVE